MLFGKSIEDTRKRLDLRLTTRAKTVKKLIVRPTFKRFGIINEDLIVIELQKNEILMDKPLYLGFCILELSKLTIYPHHYKEMIATYDDRVMLTYTDTYSFIYKTETENLYIDIALNLDEYNTSDYPLDHPLYSRTNAIVLEKFKDECASLAFQEIVGHRSKMYSILLPSGKAKFTAKGVSRRHVVKHLNHEEYLHTLKTLGSSFLKYRTIKSYKHILKTIEVNKSAYPPTTINATFFPMGTHSCPRPL